MDKIDKYRVWWIPQIPMKPFIVPINSLVEGKKILDVLADYDLFQFENSVKPDYSNVGGLSVFDPNDDNDGPNGSWVNWEDEDGNTIDDLTIEQLEDIEIVQKIKSKRK